jgi:hypothetical protein
MEKSKIEWTDSTVNFWHGCQKVSDGCKFCYMYRDKSRYGQNPMTVKRSLDSTFKAALKWEQGRKIFTCSWSDFFIDVADPWRPDAWGNESELFENKEKYLFLADLKKLFHAYKSKTNLFSVRREDKVCIGCSKGKRVCHFTIYSTGDEREVFDFGFVIDTDEGILKDIYRCQWYKHSVKYNMTSQGLLIKPEGLPAITISIDNC